MRLYVISGLLRFDTRTIKSGGCLYRRANADIEWIQQQKGRSKRHTIIQMIDECLGTISNLPRVDTRDPSY